MIGSAPSSVLELARVLIALPGVEMGRRTRGPLALLTAARTRGARSVRRDPVARARLQRIIRAVDRALFWAGRNCYRRALIEVSLDRGAAGEVLMLGLKAGGVPRSGHAWLASAGESGQYDCVFSL